MKFDFAVFTTDGETGDLPMPVALDKVTDVANGNGNFSCAQDTEIAKWMLKISKILTLR